LTSEARTVAPTVPGGAGEGSDAQRRIDDEHAARASARGGAATRSVEMMMCQGHQAGLSMGRSEGRCADARCPECESGGKQKWMAEMPR